MSSISLRLFVAACLTSAAPTFAEGYPRWKGHWTESERLAPVHENFGFEDLAVGPDGMAWVVGAPFLLRFNESIEVSRPPKWPEASVSVVRVFENGDVWGAGQRHEQPALWEYRDGWKPLGNPLPALGSVIDLEVLSPRQAFAVVFETEPSPIPAILGSSLFRYDGTSWQFEYLPDSNREQLRLRDVCFRGDRGWAVGYEQLAWTRRVPIAFEYRDRTWTRMPIPQSIADAVRFLSVSCGEDGRVLVGAEHQEPVKGASTFARLFAITPTGWESIPIPAPVEPRGTYVSAVDSIGSETWVAFSQYYDGIRVFRYATGSWSETSRPTVEGGRSTGFSIRRFASQGSSVLAIGDDTDGPGLSRGLILRYENGKWANLNWDWSYWDVPWFGLFLR